MKKYLSILFALVLAVSLMLVPAVVSADGTPTIDGTLSSGEWDSCYLGTSVTTWSGGMSVDVYGFADDTHLYAAYVADMSQPGWAAAAGLCISNNLYYKTPQSASWPDIGYTILGFGGDGIGQTDGSGWNFDSFGGWGIQSNEWANEGIEYYVGDGCYHTVPNPNVAEVKIPLSLLTYAGADGQIMLSGQYWQYDSATPFFVALPPPPVTTVPLCAGQNIDVGTVTVWDDGTNLYVEYETTGGWLMTETHLEVVTDQNAFPTTKKGNPKVGHFTYSMEHDPPVPDYTYTITLPTGTPLYIAAHAVVQKVNVITEAPYDASSVYSSSQGLRKDGTPVRWQRSTPEQGLAFETGKDEFNFFSLGFGGEIIVEFDCPIRNGEGDDVQIIEDTWGSYPLETANVSASKDGTSWTDLGESDNTNPVGIHTISQFDLGDLKWAKYIKIVDTTNREVHGANADGYDLNAVVSLQDCIEIQEETAWGDGCEGERFVEPGNWATYFTYQVQEEITLTGDWLLSVNSGTYLHDMFIISQSPTGELNGNGGYPSSGPPYNTGYDWTLTGQLTGTSVTFTIVYTNSYTATMTGTVATDFNSMNGGAGTGGVTNWTATRVP